MQRVVMKFGIGNSFSFPVSFLIFQIVHISNSNVHDVLQYLATTLNLASKDLILLMDSDSNPPEEKPSEIVDEIASTNFLNMLSIIYLNEEDISSQLQNMIIHQNQQLIVCYTVLQEKIVAGLENISLNMFPIFNFTQYHWTHNILDLPFLQQFDENALYQDLNNFSKPFSSIFRLNSKLLMISLAAGKRTAFSTSLFEVYSINDMHFLDAVTQKRVYSYGNEKYNFRGAVIKATAVDESTNDAVVTYDKSSNETKFLRGLGVFDFWDIRDMLNFSVLAMKGSSDIAADVSNNFLPTGIGRQLYDGEADISILHSYHLPEYVHHLKPLVAMGEDRIFATFRQPPSFAVRNAFSKPFSNSVWILLSLFWTLIIICVLTFIRLLHPMHSTQVNQIHGRRSWDVTETLLWSIAALCQRSFFWLPHLTSLRLIFIFTLLFSLAVYSIYSAQIISSFTAEFLPIRTLADLVEYNFQIVANPQQFYSYALLPNSLSPDDKETYGQKLANTYTTDKDAVKQVTKGFIMHFSTLDLIHLYARELDYPDNETCHIFHYIPLGTLYLTSGFYVKKNSPLQEPFNLKLIVIMERGLNGRYIKNYYEETIIKCPKSHTRYREDLGLADVFTAFLIIIVGCILALVLLFAEITVFKVCTKTTLVQMLMVTGQ